MSKKDGGSVFPSVHSHEISDLYNSATGRRKVTVRHDGLSLRDWFATFAPEAGEEWIKMQAEIDRQRNPHGDSYKPQRRTVAELRAEWRYTYADAMLAEREK